VGGGSTSLPIWLDNVQCAIEDQHLSDCSHNGWGNTNCEHTQDAGVECDGAGIDTNKYFLNSSQ